MVEGVNRTRVPKFTAPRGRPDFGDVSSAARLHSFTHRMRCLVNRDVFKGLCVAGFEGVWEAGGDHDDVAFPGFKYIITDDVRTASLLNNEDFDVAVAVNSWSAIGRIVTEE